MDERSRTQLLEILRVVQAGDRKAALAPLRALQSEAEADPEVGFAVALLTYAAGRLHEGVRWFERVARDPAWRSLGLARLTATAGGLGWERERHEAARALRETGRWPRQLDLSEFVSRSRQGDAEGAIALSRRLLAQDPGALNVRIELAGVLARSGDQRALREELAALGGAELGRSTLEAALERCRLLIEADQCDVAEVLVGKAQAGWPDDARPLVVLARFAAWRGEAADAQRWAKQAVALDPSSADAWCSLGAALHLAGEGAAASEAIARACALDPGHLEAHTWLAEERHGRGELAMMAPALNVAAAAAGGQLAVTAWVLRLLAALDDGRSFGLDGPRTEEVEQALEELVPGALANVTRDVLHRSLQASQGNRGVQATHLHEGRLRRLATRTGPRLASRAALERIRFEEPERVGARLEALASRYPDSSMPLVHLGELWLWLGQLDRAEADFRRSLARVKGTRFAWIGLTGVELLRGRLEAALEVCQQGVDVMHGTVGPAVYIYRGEVYRRLGRLAEAQQDLDAAVASSPRRLAAWMNLALVHHARGRADEAQRLFAMVEDRAPALFSDARRELEESGVTPSAPVAVERALAMMHGNRSSSSVFYETAGVLRGVPNRAGSSQEIHRHDAQDLRQLTEALIARRPLLRAFSAAH